MLLRGIILGVHQRLLARTGDFVGSHIDTVRACIQMPPNLRRGGLAGTLLVEVVIGTVGGSEVRKWDGHRTDAGLHEPGRGRAYEERVKCIIQLSPRSTSSWRPV